MKPQLKALRDGLTNFFPAQRPKLAHYTSLPTMWSILTTNSFWFSNPLWMSDSQELGAGVKAGMSAFVANQPLVEKELGVDVFAQLMRALHERYAEIDSGKGLNIYVLCFSEYDNADGDLTMWRGYAADAVGAAIAVNTLKIKESNVPIKLGAVMYFTNEQRDHWIGERIKLFVGLMKGVEDEASIQEAGAYLFNTLIYYALFIKHAGFSAEREWRAVYTGHASDPLSDHCEFEITPKGAVPKLKLPLTHLGSYSANPFQLTDAVEAIILGPRAGSDRDFIAMKGALARSFPSVSEKLRVSSIPYRGS